MSKEEKNTINKIKSIEDEANRRVYVNGRCTYCEFLILIGYDRNIIRAQLISECNRGYRLQWGGSEKRLHYEKGVRLTDEEQELLFDHSSLFITNKDTDWE